MNALNGRRIDRFIERFQQDHPQPFNQLIQFITIPLTLWAVTAMLWCLPPVFYWFKGGVWAALAMFTLWCFYNRLSRRLGYALLATFFVFGCMSRLLEMKLGLVFLHRLAIILFILGLLTQIIGYRMRNKKIYYFPNITYLLLAPLWAASVVFQKMGWKY